MTQVALSSDFLRAFAQIPRKKQKTVREALEKFKRDPTSAAQNYEKIHDVSDEKIRTVRCGIDHRAVVIHPPQGDVHLFVWVDHHDEAMAWAKRKRFEVNKHTGTLQVYEVREAGDVASDGQTNPPVAAAIEAVESEQIPAGRLLSGHDNTTLLLFGVPEPLIPAVRALREDEDLDALAPYLPQEASDALYLLASGFSADATIDELDRKQPTPVAIERPEFDPDDFSAALQRPETQRQFKVVTDDHELADILNKPLAQWRVFLHPTQRKIAEMNSRGPARVLGGAGTGKTVVAMHRAKHLAQRCPADKKVLFTTFTRNLAADIQSQLTTLCQDELDKIEVTNLHAWASGILQTRGVKVRTPRESDWELAWEDAIGLDADERFPRTFYKDEWTEVVQPQGILDEASYLRARRAGRGTRLSRNDRKQVWRVLDGVRRYLQKHGLMDHADVIREARLLIEAKKVPLRYASVVADEVQDFSEADLRLLRAMVPEGPNDLFLVGDAHQRIYGHKASLSRCGINVRGQRSKRLRLNYRTTQKIRNWSVAVLRGMTVDDLDEDKDDALKGYHSLRLGTAPEALHHDTEKQEAQFILAQLKRWLEEQDRLPNDICLVARTNPLLDARYAPLLQNAGYTVQRIETDEASLGDGIRLATMHRVKGLEFPCVLIAGVQEGSVPLELRRYSDEVARQNHYDSEKRLLFVAATRARDELVVTGYGTPSPILSSKRNA